MDEYTTASGKIVRLGQLYRDSRKSNVRTLRVDSLTDRHGVVRADCLVVRQEYEGTITQPMPEPDEVHRYLFGIPPGFPLWYPPRAPSADRRADRAPHPVHPMPVRARRAAAHPDPRRMPRRM